MTIVKVRQGNIRDDKSEALVIPFFQDVQKLGKTALAADKATDGLISKLLKTKEFVANTDVVYVHRLNKSKLSFSHLVLAGLGKRKQVELETLRRSAAVLHANLGKLVKSAVYATDDLPLREKNAATHAEAVVEGLELARYEFSEFKEVKKFKLTKFILLNDNAKIAAKLRLGTKSGDGKVQGVVLARHLANLPGNHCRPKDLAKAARTMAKESELSMKALGRAEMTKLDMNSLLSVALGSPHEPQLIVMEHNARKKNLPTICLVGKGLTFDSGGISIKPSADMDKMRYDKCGGTTVIGTMKAVAALKLPLHVVGLVPASENMPGGDANKPGDVVTASNGKTIEILNTDAEGRLILADALSYSKRFKPDVVIDLATLTGACMVALGQHCCGLFTRDDDLARDLVRASNNSFERAWRLPLWDEYSEEMKGQSSDLKNLGGRYGGAITAGAFLENFVESGRWAHLDIAGTSWDDPSRPYNKGKGATGFGVRLLIEFLRQYAG